MNDDIIIEWNDSQAVLIVLEKMRRMHWDKGEKLDAIGLSELQKKILVQQEKIEELEKKSRESK